MKKVIRNVVILAVGLLLTALPSNAGYFTDSISASGSYALGGSGVNVPSNAVINWYGYAYGGGSPNPFARIMAYMAPGGMFLDEYVSANGTASGSSGVPGAGDLNFYLEAAGSSGCGVTVTW